MDVTLIVGIGTIISVTVLVIQDFLLWSELRKFNKNFREIKQMITDGITELKPLFTALKKVTPFLEVFNAVTGWVGGIRRRKKKPIETEVQKNE